MIIRSSEHEDDRFRNDDDEDDDDDDDSDDEGEQSQTTMAKNKVGSSVKQRLMKTVNMIKLTSKSNNIKLTPGNRLALSKLVQVMTKFFSEKCMDGNESKSRLFLLEGNGEIAYHANDRPIKMKSNKLIASLILNSNKLFDYLKATSSKSTGVSAYTSDEKEFIQNFVRASGYNTKYIVCSKIKKLCK